MSEFKSWLREGDTTQPFMNEEQFSEEDHPRAKDGKFGSGGGSQKAQEAPETKDSGLPEGKPSPALKDGDLAPLRTPEGDSSEPPAPKGKKGKTDEEKAAQREEILATKSPADQEAFKKAWAKGYVVPPAWTDVWVSDDPKPTNGVIVTGRAANGKKQPKEYDGYREQKEKEKQIVNIFHIANIQLTCALIESFVSFH